MILPLALDSSLGSSALSVHLKMGGAPPWAPRGLPPCRVQLPSFLRSAIYHKDSSCLVFHSNSSPQRIHRTQTGFLLLARWPRSSSDSQLGHLKAHLVYFSSLRNHCPLLPNVQCLKNHCYRFCPF